VNVCLCFCLFVSVFVKNAKNTMIRPLGSFAESALLMYM